ncbi:MAG: hypothetical protein CL917_02445 [Deltaproteobacteria bacterium]|nr:hypothetical protein [Deltaproteobacteria bacterium]
MAPSSPRGSPSFHFRHLRRSATIRSYEIEVGMNRIRAARQALGWTQEELAKTARISARTIHAVEQGSLCRQATKRQILRALSVPWELKDEYFPRAHSVRRVRHMPESQKASSA